MDDAEPRPAADDGRDRPPTNVFIVREGQRFADLGWTDEDGVVEYAGAGSDGPVNVEESSGAAARRFAGELERLMAGLAARGVAPAGDTPVGTAPVDTALALVDRLREEAVQSDQLRGRMAELLAGVAKALKGDPGPLRMHDWSDLPVVAARVRAERDERLTLAESSRLAELVDQLRWDRDCGQSMLAPVGTSPGDVVDDGFVPPVAEGLPVGALECAVRGASRLDAAARTRRSRNLLGHALVELHREGWLVRVAPAAAPVDGYGRDRHARMAERLGIEHGALESAIAGAAEAVGSVTIPEVELLGYAVAGLRRDNWLDRDIATSPEYTGGEWTPEAVRAELLRVRLDRDRGDEQVTRLAEFIQEHLPHEIRGEHDTTAVGIAIRLLSEFACQANGRLEPVVREAVAALDDMLVVLPEGDGAVVDLRAVRSLLVEALTAPPRPGGGPAPIYESDDIGLVRLDRDRFRADLERAFSQIAAMYAAGTGREGEGPVRGVVEDLADEHALRLACEEALGYANRALERAVAERARPVEVADVGGVSDADLRRLGWRRVLTDLLAGHPAVAERAADVVAFIAPMVVRLLEEQGRVGQLAGRVAGRGAAAVAIEEGTSTYAMDGVGRHLVGECVRFARGDHPQVKVTAPAVDGAVPGRHATFLGGIFHQQMRRVPLVRGNLPGVLVCEGPGVGGRWTLVHIADEEGLSVPVYVEVGYGRAVVLRDVPDAVLARRFAREWDFRNPGLGIHPVRDVRATVLGGPLRFTLSELRPGLWCETGAVVAGGR